MEAVSEKVVHPESVREYLSILLNFLRVHNLNSPRDNNRKAIFIDGIFQETCNLCRDGESKYHLYLDDSKDEKNEDLDDVPTVDELLARVRFPIDNIMYLYEDSFLSKKVFDTKSSLPIEYLNFSKTRLPPENEFTINVEGQDVILNRESFKDYRLTKFLGRGSFGIVFQACLKNDCNYAIKIINFDNLSLGQTPAKFIREANIIKYLALNGVGPRLFDIWLTKTQYYTYGIVVTELWDGELLPTECISHELINKLEKQIEFIHSAGYVHGDIFINNVLVKRKGGRILDITLNDFGSVQKSKDWSDIFSLEIENEIFFNYYLNSPQNRYLFIDNNYSMQDVIKDPQILDRALVYYLRKYCSIVNK